MTTRLAPFRATIMGWAVLAVPGLAAAPIAAEAQRLTAHDVVVAAGVILADAALMTADRRIAHAFQQPGLQADRFWHRSATGFSDLADPGAPIVAGGLYLAGVLTHHRSLAALGLHTGEAVVSSEVMTITLKGVAGRARPRVNVDTPHDFRFGRGFGNDDYASFPSGAATAAFAIATVLSREARSAWPGAGEYVAPSGFGIATLVAVSRLYLNQHWASDVVAGAGIGALGGTLVNRYERDHPDTPLDAHLLPAP